MKGLILKDFFVLKKTMLLYLMIELVMLAAAIFNPSMMTFAVLYFLILAMMLPITALAYDERAGWNKYALTMPLSRKNLVLGKYLLGLILLGVSILLNLLFVGGYGMMTGFSTFGAKDFTMLLSVSAAAGCLFLSVLMPIMFRLGTEKGRIAMVLMILLPVGTVLILSKTGALDSITPQGGAAGQLINLIQNNMALLIAAVLVFATLLLGISLMISFAIVRKKEY